ncbi:MAG: cupin domain-containing protein [Alphaproteobacteria bacterium]|nr:cupin domain-containing protein [Alphaproteobacteria bacterium]
MIRHHPPCELLMDYASGALGEPRALAVAAHVGLCALCRTEVARLEAVGGALVEAEAETSAARDDQLLQATFDRLDRPEAAGAPVPAGPDDATRRLLPSAVWPYVAGGIDRLAWKTVGIGVREAVLAPGGSALRVSLLRIAPGRAVAKHTHGGAELTLVLAGGFTDGGEHYARGDFALADQAVDHRPVADPGEDCLCLAVREGPMRLTGAIGRLIILFLRT